MSRRSEENLDSFESALLDELKVAVRDMAPAGSVRLTGDRLALRVVRWRWQVLVAAVAAVAAAALAIALLVPGLGPTPAFAVTGRNDGEVKVRVNRLEGAEGLEQALRKRGIPADIIYLPANKQCAPDRYAELRTPGLMLSVGTDRFEVVIPPGAVGAGDTFVLSAAVVPLPDGLRASVDFGIAHGAVGPCQVIAGP